MNYLTFIECFFIVCGVFSLVFGAGAVACVITEHVLQRCGFYDEEGDARGS